MKCVAIDDETNALKVIELYAEKVEHVELVGVFTDPVKATDFIEKNRVDLLFLDINMQGLNGFELLESLTHRPMVIFTTAYSEYAVKSYTVDAIDYLVKPIKLSRFLKAVRKAEEATGKKMSSSLVKADDSTISVKSGTSFHRIKLSEILFLQAEGNYTKFVTSNEKIMVLCPMKDAMGKFDDLFVQTHRSFVVSIAKVSKVEAHQLTVGENTIPVSASYRKEVLRLLAN